VRRRLSASRFIKRYINRLEHLDGTP
jgi:hypothetical protein